MGGCRCTYRNCTVRSDGKTHFFHYPVFDKVRCHQWLTNAGRYDFLNLKVSQLKNRVVCQHHFADYCFMNSVKDKLKLQAVPTLDGPFCDPIKFDDSELPKGMHGWSLACEDIENDEYISDRKANYDIKYADFLTNCEPETPYLNENCKKEDTEKNLVETENAKPLIHVFYNNNSTQALTKKENSCNNVIKPHNNKSNTTFNHEITIEPLAPTHYINKEIVNVPVQKRNKKSSIRIISEKKITEPEKQIPAPISIASFETVSPSMILNINKTKNKSQPDNVASESYIEKDISVPELISTMDPQKFEIEIDLENRDQAPPVKVPVENKIAKSPEPPRKKMSAERIAAINEKRKFNMKLRDIIEAGLNRLDVQDGPKKKSIVKKRDIKNEIANETVASSLSKEPSLPSNNDYIISFLEQRMKRMENLFLNKIDQNTHKIMELKKAFDVQKEEPEQKVSSMSKKSSNIQGEAHKKYLYKEISKYLTPDTNSMVYEELFINKFKPNVLQTTEPEPLKKRRRRW